MANSKDNAEPSETPAAPAVAGTPAAAEQPKPSAPPATGWGAIHQRAVPLHDPFYMAAIQRKDDAANDPAREPEPDNAALAARCGVKDYFAVLGAKRSTSAARLHYLYERLVAAGNDFQHGASRENQLAMEDIHEAYRVLGQGSRNRQAYLDMLDGGGVPSGRYAIIGEYGITRYTDQLLDVLDCHRRNVKCIDLRPGEPGGPSDESVICRFKIQIPEGRVHYGRTFTYKTKPLNFVKGVAYTNDRELARWATSFAWDVTDRGENFPYPKEARNYAR